MEKCIRDREENEGLVQLADSARNKIFTVMGKLDKDELKADLQGALSDIELIKKVILTTSGGEKAFKERLAKENSLSTPEDVLKEYVKFALARALRDGVVISIVVLEAQNLSGSSSSIDNLEQVVKSSLRRRADFVVNNGRSIFVILHETEENEAVSVAERIRNTLVDYLSTKKGGNSVKINYKVTSSAEGVGSFDAMMARIR